MIRPEFVRDLLHAAAQGFSRLITYDSHYIKSTDSVPLYEAWGDVIGGLGSVWGSVLGTLVIYLLPEFLRFLSTYYFLVFGVFLALMALFMPEGLIALARTVTRRVTARRSEGRIA